MYIILHSISTYIIFVINICNKNNIIICVILKHVYLQSILKLNYYNYTML